MRVLSCLLVLALATSACRGPAAAIADQRPRAVPRARLASTLWIGSPTSTGISGFASAVAVGPRTLVTSAHVWALEEPWWEAELPPRRELALFARGFAGKVQIEDREVDVRTPGRLVHAEFRLVAAGRPVDEPVAGAAHDRQEELRWDWVLIETDTPCWDASDAAHLHPSAGDPAWKVPEGSELLVVGFSSIFDGGALGQRDDQRGEPTPAGWEQLEAFLAAGPYTLVGEAQQIEGLPGVSYPAGWPPPRGHSGGGVYLWNEPSAQAQLVGVFHTWVPLRSQITRRFAPLGLSTLAFERRTEEEEWALVYAPLAPIVSALAHAPR